MAERGADLDDGCLPAGSGVHGLRLPPHTARNLLVDRIVGDPMKIQLLYFDDCPNWRTTIQHLEQLLDEAESAHEVELVIVDDQEAAERWSFRGSPTVLVDGGDPFVDKAAPVGLSCRIYRTDTGFAGSPSLEQLRGALPER